MAQLPAIPTNTGVKDLFVSIMPDVAKKMLADSSAPAELAGTEISMVIELDNSKYSFLVKDGNDIISKEEDTASPMLRLKVSNSDIEKMIATNNLDMILGMQSDLNRVKYNALKSLKGTFVAKISNDDGSEFTIEAILNNSRDPQSLFRMSATDTSALMRRETNPVNLFMSGAMKIEGDMAFAMATQPLFT